MGHGNNEIGIQATEANTGENRFATLTIHAIGSASKTLIVHQLGETLSSESDTQNFEWNVYPNPSHDDISIEIKKPHHNAKVELRDIHGTVLWSKTVEANTVRLNVDTDQLPAGLYFIQLYDDQNRVFNKKILLTK